MLYAALLFAAALPGPVRAQDAPDRVDPTAPCVTSECHASTTQFSHLHWDEIGAECRKCHAQVDDEHEFEMEDPSALCEECHEELFEKIGGAEVVHDPAEDGCTDCHVVHGSETSGLLTSDSLPELCSDCHDDVVDEIREAEHVHDPAEEECVECHNPHYSQWENLLVREPEKLCFECHDREDVLEEAYEHGPVADGACTECHRPHSSPRENLLRASGAKLCFGCHEERAEEIEAAKFVHDPAEDDCLDCHGPHSTPYPKILRAEGRALCNECHDDVVEEAEEATVDHKCVLEKDQCLNCHSPHAADYEPMLKHPQPDLCFQCHDEPVKSGDTELIDMKSWLESHPDWHEPIRKDGCTACHQPHGGEIYRLLAREFPPTYYAPFDLDSYALCFESCHKESLVTREKTRTSTGFRDGDRNLHFLHVNRAKRGRTCRLCHELHASDNTLEIREKVPYGKWMMPLHFKESADGGSCQPGCHRLQSYDRGKQ